MFAHFTPKERTGYACLAVLFLSVAVYIGSKSLHRPPPLIVQTTSPTRINGPEPEKSKHEPPTEVIVDVIGAVAKAGLYHLPSGSRVVDAIQAAGGSKGGDEDRLNLAAKLVDGTQVFVPKLGDQAEKPINPEYKSIDLDQSPYLSTPPTEGKGNKKSGKKSGKNLSAPVDLNTATADQLETVPGIGPSTAERILDYRQQHGSYSSVDEITSVGGIGAKKLERMRPWLHV